jgi:hypothetical protein
MVFVGMNLAGGDLLHKVRYDSCIWHGSCIYPDSYVGRAGGAQGPRAIWLESVRFVRLAWFLAGKTVIFLKNPVITGG